jgi:hypothetical protein
MLKLSKKTVVEASREIVLHITRTEISLLILDQQAEPDSPWQGRWEHVDWPGSTTGLPHPDEPAKLAALFKELVDRNKLTAAEVSITLGGDFCVTRVVSGPNSRVEQELKQLEKRSERYLSLGSGPKAQVVAHSALDTRRKISWMTVINQRTLETILKAIQDAGLRIKRVEHSLIGLSRAVGMSQLDNRAPVVLVEIGKRGVDFGVSYQGRLLLDYRPGGLTTQDHIVDTLNLHLGRIQRYCSRQMQFAEGRISRVLLCGAADATSAALEQFQNQTALHAEAFRPNEVPGNWQWADNQWPTGNLSPAIGTLLADRNTESETGPDLMDYVRRLSREPLWPLLSRTCWPIAVCLLICVLFSSYNSWRESDIATQEEEAVANNRVVTESTFVKKRLLENDQELKSLSMLSKNISHTAHHELLAHIGGCLPEGVWLESLKVDRDRSILLQGSSFTEDNVYELVEHLKKVPQLKSVDLEATRPARLKSGPATMFDIRAKIDGLVNPAEEVKHGK